MNRNYLAFAALTSTLVMSAAAQASDGTINFTGALTAQTCTVAVNGTGTNGVGNVQLPTFSTSSLAAAGATAGATSFTINLTNCGAATITTAAAIFEGGAGVDSTTHNITNVSAGGATGVQLQLLDSAGKVIMAGDTGQTASSARTTMTGTGTAATAVLPYAVQYVATAATTAGAVSGSVTYSINYQ
jgi:major type 1 subunit fimbrin (pilin)